MKIRGDIASLRQVKSMMDSVVKNLGGIDILVNNAGISGPNCTLETIGDEEWNRIIGVNLTGYFYCCQAAAPIPSFICSRMIMFPVRSST